MHPRLALTSILMLPPLFLLAQHSRISLTLGPSFPTGTFSKSTPASGFAKAGRLFDLAYSYRLGRTHLSLCADLRGRINAFNDQALAAGFTSSYTGYDWQIPRGYWYTAALMGGASYSLGITRRLRTEAALMLGLAETQFPGYSVTGKKVPGGSVSDPDLLQVTLTKSRAPSFSVLGRWGLTYRLNTHLSLLAQIDYWPLKATFKNVVQTGTVGYNINNGSGLISGVSTSTNSNTQNISLDMNTLNLGLGVAWTL
jgi:hypothetical protein